METVGLTFSRIALDLFNWFLCAIAVAVVSRTVTQEAIFAELQQWAKARKSWIGRKLAYPLQCQYCFSHYPAAGLVYLKAFALFTANNGWNVTTFLLNVFVLVGVANALLIGYERRAVSVRLTRIEVEHGDLDLAGHRLEHEFMTKVHARRMSHLDQANEVPVFPGLDAPEEHEAGA